MAGLWNLAKEAARAAKGLMSKNARNTAAAEAKKERGPVKAFFHITRNENVPAIEQHGLLTNHPNANANSAAHPFRKHGTDAGGVWVTTEPGAFPVYGTSIGGKDGNVAARADALSTFKIEVPRSKLPKLRAVQEPYGRNILRRGDDPRAIQDFRTWAGDHIPTTVFLDDIKPEWLKNIGYVEETPTRASVAQLPTLAGMKSGWGLPPKYSDLRWLDKGSLKEYAGYTGHRHGVSDYDKSQQRFINDYIDKNQPITKRLPRFPVQNFINNRALVQTRHLPKVIQNNVAPNEYKRYSADFIPAQSWTDEYSPYIKPGESVIDRRKYEFAPGAISRGIGGLNMPSVRDRNFNWNRYRIMIERGKTPAYAANVAKPDAVLDWDNIIRSDGQYQPAIKSFENVYAPDGAISRGLGGNQYALARGNLIDRRANALILKQERKDAAEYLTSELGRQPTAEEIDNWTRKSIVDKIESHEYELPSSFEDWAYKADYKVINRLNREMGKR